MPPRLSLLALATSILGSCRDAPAPAPAAAGALPEAARFVATEVRFEQRQDGAVLWEGHGSRAVGAADGTAFTDVTLVRRPRAPGEAPLRLHAPRGEVALDGSTARFASVTVEAEAAAARVHLGATTYDAAAAVLDAAGPVDLNGPTWAARAAAARIAVGGDHVHLDGPVEGHWQAPGAGARP